MTGTGAVDYTTLLGFRVALRKFLHWSEAQAKAVGLTPSQHQLLLCVRGAAGPTDPSIGDVAECLMLRHHSAVELVDRAELAGIVLRRTDPDDARVIRVRMTAKGSRLLRKLTDAHLEELRRLGALLQPIVDVGEDSSLV
jgi:DNA-binding MarR family transcriptional regulator